MTGDDVTDPEWWAARVRACGGDLQRAQYDGNAGAFAECHARQMGELRRAGIKPTDSVLDAGCGYGRLLTLLPAEWKGEYVGVDFCEEFVEIARVIWKGRKFICHDLADVSSLYRRSADQFDVAVCVWVRTMLVDRGLHDVWETIEGELRKCARRVVVID